MQEIDLNKLVNPVCVIKNSNPSYICKEWFKFDAYKDLPNDLYNFQIVITREKSNEKDLYVSSYNISNIKNEIIFCDSIAQLVQDHKKIGSFLSVPLYLLQDSNIDILWLNSNEQITLGQYKDWIKEWNKIKQIKN